jgi:hypothetical protein
MNDFRKKFNVIAFLAEQNYVGDSPRDYTVERFAEDVLLREIDRLNEDLRSMSLLSEQNAKEADGLAIRVKELEDYQLLYKSLQEETKGFYDWGSDRRDEVIALRVENRKWKSLADAEAGVMVLFSSLLSESMKENEALQKAKDTWHQVAVENAKETEQVRKRVKELEADPDIGR